MADALVGPALFVPSRSPLLPSILASRSLSICGRAGFACPSASATCARRRNRSYGFKVHAVVAENDEPKWWEKNSSPNMLDIHSAKEFLNALSQAGDKLVVVEFYGTWCGSCRGLFPKLCKTAEEHPDVFFLKVDFDENKPMCRRLNVRVLPFFHFYRGADGKLESFSCSLPKFQRIKEAIATHNAARCSIGPPLGVGDIDLSDIDSLQEKPAKATTTT